jgi:hypothetical protein
MACPSYRINPNYTPGSNYPQYDYTDIASTPQFDPYGPPRQSQQQQQQQQQSFMPAPSAPPVTPYAHYTNQVTGSTSPSQEPLEQHFIFDLPPELKSEGSSTASPITTTSTLPQQQQQENLNYDAIMASQERDRQAIAASQGSLLREIQRQTSSRRLLESQHPNHRELAIITVPMSTNPIGSDSIHPRKTEMKRERHVKMAVGVVSGALVGTLVLGPVGTVLGAPIGCYTANKLSKQGERRAQRKWEQRSVQDAAAHSCLVQSGAYA